jgi:DNA-binding NarL/FixJ family response regulator
VRRSSGGKCWDVNHAAPLSVPPVRVLVVDDHAFIRAGVCRLLSNSPGITVVGDCDDGVHAAAAVARTRPHVVIMDFEMPISSGPEATREIRADHPHVRVLILTGSPASDRVAQAAEAGAVGLLAKSGDPAVLVSAVQRIASGGTAWPTSAFTI